MISMNDYCTEDFEDFKRLFKIYFRDDLGMKAPESQLNTICNFINTQIKAEQVKIKMLRVDDEAAGFAIYQIDRPEKDWCVFEGHGCIREFSVLKKFRNNGYGRGMFMAVKAALSDLCAKGIYLTSDDSARFWLKMGFEPTGETCNINDDPIYVLKDYPCIP